MTLLVLKYSRVCNRIFANTQERLTIARVFQRENSLGPANRLKIAVEGLFRGFSLLSLFLPPSPDLSVFPRSLFLSRSQFIEALGTCHLSAAYRGHA